MQEAGERLTYCDAVVTQSASPNTLYIKHWLLLAHSNQGMMVNKVDTTAVCIYMASQLTLC